MQLEEIRALVLDDLQRVDQTIVQRLASDIVLVNQVAQYIVSGGGKRLRPLSVVLAARACGHQGQKHAATLGAHGHDAHLPAFGWRQCPMAISSASWARTGSRPGRGRGAFMARAGPVTCGTPF